MDRPVRLARDDAPDVRAARRAAGVGEVAEEPQLTPHQFPRGASPGTFLHSLFEDLDFTQPVPADWMAARLQLNGFEEKWTPVLTGSVHPISQVMDELAEIFADMGFAVAEGPQVESDWYNFDALNIPPEHPARQEHDTFFMARAAGDDRPPHVLRTHTSPVQIRAMQASGPSQSIARSSGVSQASAATGAARSGPGR